MDSDGDSRSSHSMEKEAKIADQKLEKNLEGKVFRTMNQVRKKNKPMKASRKRVKGKKQNKDYDINRLNRVPSVQLEPQAMPVKINFNTERTWRSAVRTANAFTKPLKKMMKASKGNEKKLKKKKTIHAQPIRPIENQASERRV